MALLIPEETERWIRARQMLNNIIDGFDFKNSNEFNTRGKKKKNNKNTKRKSRMELRSTITKTLQRFALPRSKSSIGSLTITASENSINTMEEKSDELTKSSKRRPPPLSYNQHNRPSSQPSSAVRAHPTEIDKIPDKNKMDVVKKKSQIQRDLTFHNLHDIIVDHHEETHRPSPTQSRSSLKSFLPKRFQSVTVSSSIDSISQNEVKQKKRRPSFRQFSQILKRSHSAHSDLTAVSDSTRNESSLPMASIEIESASSAESNASVLKPICEEENSILHQKEIVTNDNRTPESLGISSVSSLSDRSSGSNKFSSTSNLPTKPEDTSSTDPVMKAPKLFLPDPMQENRRYLTKSNSYQHPGPDRTQPLKMATNEFEPMALESKRSLVSDAENSNPNQQTNAVKLRDRNSKKKKAYRDFKPRISLPPDVRNNFLHRTASAHQSSSSDERHLPLKASESSRQFPSNSLSVQALDRSLNQSSSSLFAHLSRTEQRRSMLDLGWGKIESYIKLEKLGEGTYANVFKGTSNLRNGFVALKEIRLEQEEGAPCTALREVSLLKGLKHNNIVSLYDIIFDKTTLTLVFEYIEKDLKRYMDDCRNMLSSKNVRLFLFQLLRGLEFCHSKKILHRDLKPQNLLINERGELKLADFGLARIKSFPTKMYSNEVVTLWYRPPDVLLGSTEYSTPIDIWAVGCIFYEMTCGRALFAGSKVEDELHLIFKYLGTPTEETMPGVTSNPDFLALKAPIYPGESLNRSVPQLDPIGIDLLERCLRYNPLSRISAQDAMTHPFFDCYPPEILKLKPEQSVLSLKEISLSRDHGSRFLGSSMIKTAVSKRSSVHL